MEILIRCLCVLILTLCLQINHLMAEKIGFLIMATGKYTQFVDPLINSAEKYFCTDHEVTYFVFTDGYVSERDNVVQIYQSRLGWPFDTMHRYHVYYKNRDALLTQDYLFASDADMLFVDSVGDEILGKRVATQHPGFVGRRGSYETNPSSRACICDTEGDCYYAGGFYGGSTPEMMRIFQQCIAQIDQDFENGLVAVWHDESHWNRYLVDNPPTVVLNPSYCYPESWNLPYKKKLLALDKQHSQMRQ